MSNIDTTVGSNKKLIPRFRGPYVVHKVLENDRYVIRDGCQLTQLPYDGVIEAKRLKLWSTPCSYQTTDEKKATFVGLQIDPA